MFEIRFWPKIQVGKYTLYVASTSEQKKQGLQFVGRLPLNHLMLFPNMSADNYFHTVRCLFPIDIIPLNSDNNVLDIWSVGTNMKLVGPTPHKTTAVIEAPFGWAQKMKLKIGSNLLETLLA